MPHREATKRFIEDMQRRGESPWTAAPLFFRLLWVLGYRIRPPYYLQPRTLFLLLGGTFGIQFSITLLALGVAMNLPLEQAVFGLLLGGPMFGALMAMYYRRAAARLRLPPWESYDQIGSSGPVSPLK